MKLLPRIWITISFQNYDPLHQDPDLRAGRYEAQHGGGGLAQQLAQEGRRWHASFCQCDQVSDRIVVTDLFKTGLGWGGGREGGRPNSWREKEDNGTQVFVNASSTHKRLPSSDLIKINCL